MHSSAQRSTFVILLMFVTVAFLLPDSSLKKAFEDDFLIGAALNNRQISDQDKQAMALIEEHFNSISPENLLKWERVHPHPEEYNFVPADQFVALGEENNMFIIGHTLVWHQQTPDWVFEDEKGNEVGKEKLLNRMQQHITTVAGRYKGKIDGWDVVNEALEEDGSLRKSKWLEIIGEDYLSKAFAFAHESAPQAELYYNDYNLWKASKRDGAIRIIKKLQQEGIQVDGIGMQGHYSLDAPSIEDIEASILAFSDLGVKVMITELDIDVLPKRGSLGADLNENYEGSNQYNPYPEVLPDSMQEKLAERYAKLFALFHKHRDKISRVTFWGVADHHSWLNNWPIRGRTSYPLLFDRKYQTKPAFDAILEQAANSTY